MNDYLAKLFIACVIILLISSGYYCRDKLRYMKYYLRKQCSIAFIVYLGQMLVGFGLGWSAPIVSKLQDPEQTPLPHVISASQASWIGSVLFIGCIISPYISSYLSNTLGRKFCLFIGGVTTAFSLLLLALSKSFTTIIIGRIINGAGIAIVFITNLVYIGEIASAEIRGILLTALGIFSTFGTLLVYSVGPFTRYSVTSYVGLAITVVYLVGLTLVPESPVFYIMKGKEAEVTSTLMFLGRENDADTFTSTKIAVIEEKSDWKDLFRIKTYRKALWITFTLNILVQGSGIIVVTFFATSIFELAGSSIEPHIATIVIGFTQVVSSSIAPLFVERSGRKVLLLASSALCAMSLSLLGTYFYLDEYGYDVIEKVKWLPLVLLILFFITFDMGLGVIPGTLIGEMFASKVRRIGSAITITSAWLFGFLVSTAFGYLIEGVGPYGTFWLFSGCCLVAFFFTLFLVPETKGKSLAEIQEILNK